MKLTSRKAFSGSAMVETVIFISIVLAVLFVQVRLIQCVAATNALQTAVNETSELLGKYAIFYHKYGTEMIGNNILSVIANKIEDKLGTDKANKVLTQFVDLRSIQEYGDNLIYRRICKKIIEYYLSEDKLVKLGYINFTKIDLSESTFFTSGDDITLSVRASLYGKYYVGASACTRAWIGGDNPISGVSGEDSVWSLDNFTRGITIRKIFGANLDYDYPVISYYKDGEAWVIKSLDHTKETYQKGSEIESEVKGMIDKFRKFSGSGDIKASDIKKRKLILVVPTDEMNKLQLATIGKCVSYAGLYGILFEMVTFQSTA